MHGNRNIAAPIMENAGKPIARYESREKVTGGKIYADDLPLPGPPAYAYMVTSSIAKGRITNIDDKAARAIPGVLMIMTHENRPPIKATPQFAEGGFGMSSQEPLGGAEILHDGQIVAFVVAQSFEVAREAASLIDISYDEQRPSTTFDSPGVTTVPQTQFNPNFREISLGDVESALAESAFFVDVQYSTPVQHHNALELFTTTAFWDSDGLTVFEPSQFVWGAKATLALQFDIPIDQVRVKSPYVGGAFGSKAKIGQRTGLTALAAKHLKRPVKLVTPRDQGFTISGHRQETKSIVRLGCDSEGHLTGYDHTLNEFSSRLDPYSNKGVDKSAAMYAFKSIKSTTLLTQGDRNFPTFMRSPPEMPVMYALESAMNELAAKAGIDPVVFRKINDTRINPVDGTPYTSRSLNECYDAAAESFGWSARNPEPGSMRDGDWLIGWGCATATYPTGLTSSAAKVTLNADGSAKIKVAAQDVGTGATTIIGQTAGERLGISPDMIKVQCGDSDLPPGPISGGSVTTASVTSAVAVACDNVLAKLGASGPMSDRDRRAAFERLGTSTVVELAEWTPPGVARSKFGDLYKGGMASTIGVDKTRSTFAFGAEMVEVRINAHTREIRVPRMTGAFAAGRIMNPRTARSQYLGGMIWGMASALLEATELDERRGRYINDNLAEYLIATNADVPNVNIIMVPEVDNEINVLGVKGIGELANVGTAAAITDAVYHATGIRVRDLPVRIENLF